MGRNKLKYYYTAYRNASQTPMCACTLYYEHHFKNKNFVKTIRKIWNVKNFFIFLQCFDEVGTSWRDILDTCHDATLQRPPASSPHSEQVVLLFYHPQTKSAVALRFGRVQAKANVQNCWWAVNASCVEITPQVPACFSRSDNATLVVKYWSNGDWGSIPRCDHQLMNGNVTVTARHYRDQSAGLGHDWHRRRCMVSHQHRVCG